MPSTRATSSSRSHSATNGVASNVLDDSNDTLNLCGRADVKLVSGLLFGGSGCYTGGETAAHLGRQRIAAHVRFNGGASFPLIAEVEVASGKDARLNALDLRRDGFYGEALYTLFNLVQVGVRYDEITKDKDAQNGENGVAQANSKIKTFTAGVHLLPLGHDKYKNVSLKFDYFNVKEDGRKVNGVLSESYNEFLVAAQVAF